jgi:hypothetical protein
VGHLCLARDLGMLHPGSCGQSYRNVAAYHVLGDYRELEVLRLRHDRLMKDVQILFFCNC